MAPTEAIENTIMSGRMRMAKERSPHTRAVRLHEKAHLPPNLDLR